LSGDVNRELSYSRNDDAEKSAGIPSLHDSWITWRSPKEQGGEVNLKFVLPWATTSHGGQIWPWSWVAALVHGRFNYGLNRLGALQVFTSSGVGTWGMPMRVGTKSEIVLLRFEAGEKEQW